jgi:hypothetical protein
MVRYLNRDFIHGEDTIVEVAMSEAQWAHLVASAGLGEGTPVTLLHAPVRGTPALRMRKLTPDGTRESFRQEIEEATRRYAEKVGELHDKANRMLQAGPLRKGDLSDLARELGLIAEQMKDNLGFIQAQFERTMEKTTSAAKSDLEAFVSGLAQRTGIEALRQMAPVLTLAAPAKQPALPPAEDASASPSPMP